MSIEEQIRKLERRIEDLERLAINTTDLPELLRLSPRLMTERLRSMIGADYTFFVCTGLVKKDTQLDVIIRPRTTRLQHERGVAVADQPTAVVERLRAAGLAVHWHQTLAECRPDDEWREVIHQLSGAER